MTPGPRHHPDDAWIAAAAGGTLDPALGLLVVAHGAYCCTCAQRFAEYEAVAAGLHCTSVAPEPCRRTQERLSHYCRQEETACITPSADGDCCEKPFAGLPRAIGVLAEAACRGKGWQSNGRGARFLSLEPVEAPGTTVRLYDVGPQGCVSRHCHEGREVALVLRGGYRDELGRFGPGDVETVPPGVAHAPVADAQGCVCLAVTEGEIRILGLDGLLVRAFRALRLIR
ncbi:MAG: cupin domain-containing protein [Alphaproteobacteria bacterium]|nr:cupin domain-containing protein [Alphaproteobacteria bacterium]